MAESTKTSSRSTGAKTADKPASTSDTFRGEQGATLEKEPEQTATGADVPLAPVDGEKRPEEYTSGEELFKSATYRHTHGVPAAEQRHDLADT